MAISGLGLERKFASVPTMDTERQAPFSVARSWNPSHIEIFGHSIDIDIPTGNLLVSTGEVAYPYYNSFLGINRKYDVQEQHMQISYLWNNPNVNLKPHWFGNWQFAYEADIDEVWHNTYPELHVTSGVGANGLFEITEPVFKRNLKDGGVLDDLIRTYGIPRRTLKELEWQFTKNDFLLRTLRGTFQILTGYYQAETLVDDINSEMWLFNPISGSAFHITSRYFFNIPDNHYRDVGYPLIVRKLVDSLGHVIELKPSAAAPPFKEYVLSDGSGREFHLELDEALSFLDGLNPGGEVRKYLVSKVTDGTKMSHNTFEYKYNDHHLLEQVVFPSTIGSRYIRYYYEDPDSPGVLTAIENSHGHKIQFEYIEDPTDNDERLSPRLKIKRITDPEGIAFEYEYDYANSEVTVTISEDGNTDRRVNYTYIRDIHNTKQRYITSNETVVRQGYEINPSGAVVVRDPNNPLIVKNVTEYSQDGHFNIIKETDPLGRTTLYEYNDFNQVIKVWDFDNHLTEYIYDVSDSPSSANPQRYDMLSVKKENITRTIDPSTPGNFIISNIVIEKCFEYDKYDGDNSDDPNDHCIQSTHRICKETNERGKIWNYTFDDLVNNNPLSPTLLESPLGIKTQCAYNNRGERETITDAESNVHTFEYNEQGNLKEYIDPNQGKATLIYYPCGNWIKESNDQLNKITQFIRKPDGQLETIIDPVLDSTDYEYYKNGRFHKIIHHRPSVQQDPNAPSHLTKAYPNLGSEFRYSPLGRMTYLKNPKGLELISEYDETGQMYQWYHNIPGSKPTIFVYDAAGQLQDKIDRKDKRTSYAYYYSGLVKTIQYPEWRDGANNIIGKLVEYKKYDYLNHILSIEDSEIPGNKEFLYDEVGNMTFRRDPDGFELVFSYDDDSRLSNVKESSGSYEIILVLDNLGRPISVQDSGVLDGSLRWEYKYEMPVGSAKKVLNLFERNLPAIGLLSNFNYDEKNRLNVIGHEWRSATPASIFSQSFDYRDDDLIESITGDNANSFRYDGIKQLIYESQGNLSSDYDAAGNRLYREDKTAIPNPHENDHNEFNRLEKDNGLNADFTFDDNGNIRTSSYPSNPTEYLFDGANRLRCIRNNQYEISYIYDYEGKLVERKETDVAAGTIENTRLHYLQSKPILVERNSSPLMLLTWDSYGKLLRIRRQQTIGGGTYPNSIFPLYDGLGNIVQFVNGVRASLAIVSYDTWGCIGNIVDPQGLFELWGFRGGIFDKTSQNLLFGTRWYSPLVGKWISEDPIVTEIWNLPSMTEDYQELSNLYCYVLNDPVNRLDPWGLQAIMGGSITVFGRPWWYIPTRAPIRGGRYPVRTPRGAIRGPKSTGTPRGGMKLKKGFGRGTANKSRPGGEELIKPTGKELWWKEFMDKLADLLDPPQSKQAVTPGVQSPQETPTSEEYEEYYIDWGGGIDPDLTA